MSNYSRELAVLGSATVEKEVENVYWNMLKKGIPDAEISAVLNTDGILYSKKEEMVVLLEFKYDYNFKRKGDISKVLTQVVYYLKAIEDAGNMSPKTVFVGDINECFVLKTNKLAKYLQMGFDWSISPSAAPHVNVELKSEIMANDDINPMVFDVSEELDFDEVVQTLKNSNTGEGVRIRITERNFDAVITKFENNVLTRKGDRAGNGALLINLIVGDDNYYVHPTRKTEIVTPSGTVKVKAKAFKAFMAHYEMNLTASEADHLISIRDRFMDDEQRRRSGDFYTPTIWVNRAHELITDSLGANWKREYAVWDCAAGTGNLTRDYTFSNLYQSTLFQDDIDIMNANRINPESDKFVMDFLNTGLELDGLPDGLRSVIESNGKLIFFINAPYATANVAGTTEGEHRAGVMGTVIGEMMNEDGLAKAKNLYAQFMYKIAKLIEEYSLANVYLYQFSPTLFATGGSYKAFRDYFGRVLTPENAFLFQASEFSGTQSNWGIMFSEWRVEELGVGNPINTELLVNTGSKLESIGYKSVYSLDIEAKASDWIREEIKGVKTFDAPQMSSWYSCKQKGRGKVVSSHLGYITTVGNSVYKNGTDVFITQSCTSMANGLSIIPENFLKVVALFTARKTIKKTWVNDKDEYAAPNTSHEDYKQWNNDAIVYSLFNTSSQQSSLRDIDYKEKKWDIKNEFFWMNKDVIKTLAEKYEYNDMLRDMRGAENSFLRKNYNDPSIYSDDALDLLVMAKKLVVETFPFREAMAADYPEYHLHAWDAGWQQIKRMAQEYTPVLHDEFVAKYKEFEERMREGVYKFGFLRV